MTQAASSEESISNMEKPRAHGPQTDPTQLQSVIQLPPFSHLVSQDWSPLRQHPPSPPAGGFLISRIQTSHNTEPQPSVQMQDTRYTDGMSASMGLPHNVPILLAGHDEASTGSQQTQASTQNRDSPTPTPSRYHFPETTQNMNNNLTYPAAERENGIHDTAAADAIFLLKVLNLRDMDHIPTLKELHNSPPTEPILLDRTTTSLVDMQFSPKVIILSAALISRVATLRHIEPIFPPDCPWYFEGDTPHATLVIALRVAQLFFSQEPLDGRNFYPLLDFYPYEEMAAFARRLGVTVFKEPIAEAIEGLRLEEWRALKWDFEREAVL